MENVISRYTKTNRKEVTAKLLKMSLMASSIEFT